MNHGAGKGRWDMGTEDGGYADSAMGLGKRFIRGHLLSKDNVDIFPLLERHMFSTADQRRWRSQGMSRPGSTTCLPAPLADRAVYTSEGG